MFIWSLVRLSKDYYYSLEYHINFTNLPGNLRLTSISDSTITLKIKLQGYDFFSEEFLLKQARQVDISLQSIKIRNIGENTIGYLITSRLGREIIAQTNFPSDLYVISPDTLFFEFERQSLRRMPSKPTPGFIKIQISGKDTLMRLADSLPHKNNRR